MGWRVISSIIDDTLKIPWSYGLTVRVQGVCCIDVVNQIYANVQQTWKYFYVGLCKGMPVLHFAPAFHIASNNKLGEA